MATLVCDMPLPVHFEELELCDLPIASALSFFRNMEFDTLAKRFQQLAENAYGKEHFRCDVPALERSRDPQEQRSLF